LTLKEKLRELDRVQPKVTAVQPVTRQASSLDELLGGAEENGCFAVQRRVAIRQVNGFASLNGLHEISATALAIAGQDERLVEFDLARALFLDTETTGLAGGTGTVAFLVGVGRFEGNEFVVRQYFLRQLHEEVAMLKRLQALLGECTGLVTFNGKSFDIPLLRTRTVLHRLGVDFDRMHHFDVLHAARRLWKDQVQSCSLGGLESSILRRRRQQDISGALIPQVYFDFLRYGEASRLPEVLAHNRQDIVSTAALLLRIAQLVQHPLHDKSGAEISPSELRRVAMLYRRLGDFAASARLFEQLLQQPRAVSRLEDYFILGLCYKSQRRYDEAKRLWHETVERLPFHPLPYIELAKHCEHRESAFAKALEWVERALRNLLLSEELGRGNGWLPYKNDLLYRKSRLQHKLAKDVNGNVGPRLAR
jgi:uncharacterized protein YprB with RNaseH-like and TPR domain